MTTCAWSLTNRRWQKAEPAQLTHKPSYCTAFAPQNTHFLCVRISPQIVKYFLVNDNGHQDWTINKDPRKKINFPNRWGEGRVSLSALWFLSVWLKIQLGSQVYEALKIRWSYGTKRHFFLTWRWFESPIISSREALAYFQKQRFHNNSPKCLWWMTIKINFTLFEPWGEKVKMKSSPWLLSAFPDRSLNYLWRWVHR